MTRCCCKLFVFLFFFGGDFGGGGGSDDERKGSRWQNWHVALTNKANSVSTWHVVVDRHSWVVVMRIRVGVRRIQGQARRIPLAGRSIHTVAVALRRLAGLSLGVCNGLVGEYIPRVVGWQRWVWRAAQRREWRRSIARYNARRYQWQSVLLFKSRSFGRPEQWNDQGWGKTKDESC